NPGKKAARSIWALALATRKAARAAARSELAARASRTRPSSTGLSNRLHQPAGTPPLSTKTCALPPLVSQDVVWGGKGWVVMRVAAGASGCLKSGPTAQPARAPNARGAASARTDMAGFHKLIASPAGEEKSGRSGPAAPTGSAPAPAACRPPPPG